MTEATLLHELRGGLDEIVGIILGDHSGCRHSTVKECNLGFFRTDEVLGQTTVPNAQETHLTSASFMFLYYFSLLT